MGHATLSEFPLVTGRRADVLSLSADGEIWIIEVKSCLADYQSDRKWHHYLEWCDRLFFAVEPCFPIDILPTDAGLILADSHDAVIDRTPPRSALVPARRRALTLRFCHIAAARLAGENDPIFY